jgi:hypothetical protein
MPDDYCTEYLGPPAEWDPVDRDSHQRRHNQFWKAVQSLLPDDENDEPFWMSEEATAKLKSNTHN